ncbi:MAG: hypothetical protein AB7G37_00830 [Solirubrobacteraceae bacterium]
MSVQVGQVWASNDKSDRQRGVRQHRTVTAVREHSASLEGRDVRGHRVTSSVLISSGRIAGHRLIEEVTS